MHSLECQESELSEAAQANIAKLSEEIKELNEVIEEKKGAHSRLKLEIDNFRQRTKSELASARGKAAIPLVQELLPIADEYEYAKQNLKIETDGQKAVVTKFEALFDKMLQSWKSLGIEKMNSVGETFNPELHEAVSMIPSQEYKEAGMSCRVVTVSIGVSQCSVCKEPLFLSHFSPGGGLQRASPWLDFEDTRMGEMGECMVLLWCCPRK